MGEQNGQLGMNDIQRMMALVSGQSSYDIGDWADQLRTWLDGIEARQRPIKIDGIQKITGAGFMLGGIRWELYHVEEHVDKYIFDMVTPHPRGNITIELNRVPSGPYQYDLSYNGSTVDTINHNDLKEPHYLLAKIETILSMI